MILDLTGSKCARLRVREDGSLLSCFSIHSTSYELLIHPSWYVACESRIIVGSSDVLVNGIAIFPDVMRQLKYMEGCDVISVNVGSPIADLSIKLTKSISIASFVDCLKFCGWQLSVNDRVVSKMNEVGGI